jgi:hypothetical protein
MDQLPALSCADLRLDHDGADVMTGDQFQYSGQDRERKHRKGLAQLPLVELQSDIVVFDQNYGRFGCDHMTPLEGSLRNCGTHNIRVTRDRQKILETIMVNQDFVVSKMMSRPLRTAAGFDQRNHPRPALYEHAAEKPDRSEILELFDFKSILQIPTLEIG